MSDTEDVSDATPADEFLELVRKIAAGALIPSFATIIFNLLHHLFDYLSKSEGQILKVPPPPNSAYDIGVGCVFSLIGICVASKNYRNISNFLLVFVILLILILASFLLVTFAKWDEFWTIMASNVICFVALCWAIAGVD